MSKHTERTLALLRQHGYACDIVERYVRTQNEWGGKRRDLFGIIDILAIDAGTTLGVQSCGSDFAEHRTKILASPHLSAWLSSPGRALMLIGWRKVAAYRKDGSRAARDRWAPRVVYFSMVDGEPRAGWEMKGWPDF